MKLVANSFALAGALSLIMAAAPSVQAQVTKQGSAYLFRMKFTPGQTMSYNMVSSASMGAQGSQKMSSPMKMVVKSVKSGIATVETSFGPMSMNGQSQGKPQVSTVTMDSRGKMTGGGMSAIQSQSVSLPEKAVALGGAWAVTQEIPSPMGSMKINATYKFVKIVTRGGQQCAELSIQTTGGSAQVKTKGSGTLWVRMSDGSMQEMSQSQTITISMPAQQGKQAPPPMNVTNSVAITRK